ncbi:MAG: shikimate dehydrogenase [Microcystis aeruginosa DA14]|uniref:Shikimate dehydrogenase (NADP(+)) n=1 Tax=Microcystis aeruginosa DA14 TaxID=1987506 RepID=A0A3E0MDI3_MICAE|nr:MAG: shikimate dehydrogenase [Microcystis aeruginosa DA14]
MIRACCIGWPVTHIRSPLIHGFWLSQYGIAGTYTREAVEPGDVARFLRSLADQGLAGCNVTIPHKEAAFAAMDDVDPGAVAVGAVNTVWHEDGRLVGMNSDVVGFLKNLDDHVPGWEGEVAHALVLGAGGAARGIVHGLVSRGVPLVTLANRSLAKAKAIAAAHPRAIRTQDWQNLPAALADVDLLINTTSLGMSGQPPLDLPLRTLKPSAIVSDIVYVPLETDLLARAAARGHRTVEGLGMLLHQAVPGFARWFGVTPQVTPALYEHLAADVRGH